MATRNRLTFHGTLLIAALVILLVMAAAPLRQAYHQRQALTEEKVRLQALRVENKSLEQRLSRLNDPEYQEKLAREQLGLVRPGETSYVVVPGPASTQTVRAPVAPKEKWYERLGDWFKGLFA